MLAKVLSGAIVGLDCLPVTVEVDVASRSLPSFQIVGLPNKTVEESKERVRSAIVNSGFDFPVHRLTVNLAPADIPKEGSLYDLPVAVGILLANGSLRFPNEDCMFAGELSLDGTVRPISGALPLAMLAKEKGIAKIYIPADNAREAAIVEGVGAFPVNSLKELIDDLLGVKKILPLPFEEFNLSDFEENEFDFADIKGQEFAKRAMEIAAAGGHNILLQGTPGSGKTLLARAFCSILPVLTEEESIEITKIYSVSKLLPSGKSYFSVRPFRSPHHTASHVGIIGGGTHPKPGEVSLAHRGTLFLDEIAEFPRQVLEALRQPLEDGFVTVSRAAGSSSFPSKFILLAASNPCPCGFLGDEKKKCICTQRQIDNYKKRLSGPLLDRIDLHVFCSAIPPEKLTNFSPGESSKIIRSRVQKARDIQNQRYKNFAIKCNAELNSKMIKQFCPLDVECKTLLESAIIRFNLSGRGFHRLLKVSRTIADLAGAEKILVEHLSEALQFREKSVYV